MPIIWDPDKKVYTYTPGPPPKKSSASLNRIRARQDLDKIMKAAQKRIGVDTELLGSGNLRLDPQSHEAQKHKAIGLQRQGKKALAQAKALGKDEDDGNIFGDIFGGIADAGTTALTRTMDILSRPNFAVANTANYFGFGGNKPIFDESGQVVGSEKYQDASNPFEAIWGGLSGENKTTFTEILGDEARETVAEQRKTRKPLVAGGNPLENALYELLPSVGIAAGFALDLGADPTTYLGSGVVSKAGKADKVTKAGKIIDKAVDADKAADAIDTAKNVEKVVDAVQDANPAIKAAENADEANKLKKVLDADGWFAPGKKTVRADFERSTLSNLRKLTRDKGLNPADPEISKLIKEATKNALDAEDTAKLKNINRLLDELAVLLKTVDKDKAVALKILGKPVVSSKTLYKAGKLPGKAAPKFLKQAFVPGLELSNRDLYSIQQRLKGVARAQFDREAREIKDAFSGLSKADDEAILRLLETGGPVPDHLKPAFDFANDLRLRITQTELDAGLLKSNELKDNYIYHVYKAPKSRFGKTALKKGEKFGTIQEAVDAGAKPVTRASEMLAHRLIKNKVELAKWDTLTEIGERFGVKAKGPNRTVKMLKSLVDEGSLVDGEKLGPALRGYYVPSEVANDIDKMTKIWNSEENLRQLGQLYDKVLTQFKFAVTAPNPGYHVRNQMGDMWVNYLDGVTSPSWWNKGRKILRSNKKANANSVVIHVGDTKLTADQVAELYEQSGLKSGYFRTDTGIPPTGAKLSAKFTDPIRNFSQQREDWGRVTHFNYAIEDGLKKGLSLDLAVQEAGARVKKFNFDYSELTEFERKVMKRVIPFYTFMRKNVPLQTQMIFARPGRVVVRAKGARALQELLYPEGDDIEEPLPGVIGVIPDWLRAMDPVGLTPETFEQDPTYWAPDLPINQPFEMFGGFLEGPSEGSEKLIKELLGMTTPALKVPYEIAREEDIASGTPVENDPLSIFTRNIPAARTFTSDLGKEESKQSPTFTINIGGQEVEIPENILNYLTGIGLRKVTPNRLMSQLFLDMEEDQEYISKKRKELRNAKTGG